MADQSTKYEHLDRLNRDQLAEWTLAAAALDVWVHQEHGIIPGRHGLGHLLDLLAAAGYAVTPGEQAWAYHHRRQAERSIGAVNKLFGLDAEAVPDGTETGR